MAKKKQEPDYGKSVRIRTETKNKADKYCKRKRVIITHFISDAIEEKLTRINDQDAD